MTTQEILEGIESGKYKIDYLDVFAETGKYNEYKDEVFAKVIKDALLERKSAQFDRHKIDKKKVKAEEDIEIIRFYFVLKAGGKDDDR